MAGYATFSPALAGGPPGWLLWAVGGTVATVGAIWVGKEVLEFERDRTRAEPRVVPLTRACPSTSADKKCPHNKRYGARVHAQGTDCGGRTGSTIGGAPINKTGTPVTVAEGLSLSAATWALLGRLQKKVRETAKAKADAYISLGPLNGGYLGKKSFPADDRSGGKRYDVDTFGDGPSFLF